MPVSRAIFAMIAAAACGATPPPAGDEADQAPVATDVRLGGCAPIRYRELDPEAEAKKKPKPPPIAIAYDLRRADPSLERALRPHLTAIQPRLAGCFTPDSLDRAGRRRVQVTLYKNPTTHQVTGVRVRPTNRCVENLVRSRIRSAPSSRRTRSAYFYITASRPGTAPPQEPDRIELVDGRDRVGASLKLAAAVAGRAPGLARCVGAAALANPGQLAITLPIEKGVAGAADVNAAGELATCVSAAVDGIDLGDDKLTGVFQCAASYGIDKPARPAFTATVSADAIAVAGGAPISGALVREQRPPNGPLYAQLSKRRFSADGGDSLSLRVAADAPGSLVIRLAEAAAAADVAIGAVEVARDDGWTAVAELGRLERPRLSPSTAASAGANVVVGNARLWVGAASNLLAVDLETSAAGALDALAAQLAKIRAAPGLAHRRDVVIGVDPEVSGALLGAVIERARQAGFDQLELVSAETARARLAR